MKSSKDDMATAACELIDDQSERINALEQRQAILWALVAILSALLVF